MRSTLIPSLAFAVLLAAGGAPAAEPDYTLTADTKPHAIRSAAKLVLHDAKRNKDLQLRVTWPDAKGPFPVIVWSHGAFGRMLTEKSWKEFTKPLFVMTGSKDGPTRTGQPAEWRKKPYELSPPGDKFLVWVEGLDHGYGGITGVRPNPKNQANPDHVRWTQLATLPLGTLT